MKKKTCWICEKPTIKTMWFIDENTGNYDKIDHGYCGSNKCLKEWQNRAKKVRVKISQRKYLEKMFWLVDRVSF